MEKRYSSNGICHQNKSSNLFEDKKSLLISGWLKKLKYAWVVFCMSFIQIIQVSATTPVLTGNGGDLATSKLVTGTKKLINDASMTGMILAPFIAVGLIVYFFIRKGAADEMDQKKWSSRIWVTLFCLVGVELAGVIIGLITRYYN